MKNFLKLSAVAAVLVASATFASADPINLASSSSSVNYIGYVQGTAPFNDANPSSWIATGAGSSAVSLTLPTTGPSSTSWAPALSGSSWVSNNANSIPGGSYIAPNGYYTYTTKFSATAGTYSGTLEIQADDTVAVYLNGVLILDAAAIGDDNACAINLPSCWAPDSVSFDATLNGGTDDNTLTFVVEQTGSASEGFDYTASLSDVPEPSTLLLLGTGLLGSAGALFRRMRS